MSTSEEQHIDVVRRRLQGRFPDLDTRLIDEAIDAAHHRFDGRPVRDFVPLLVERAAATTLNTAPSP
ncbi:three-helix bundle dimerization domain-containing protein [Rhodococcus koreensis]|uniref:three-helix bundle dimerization domain-containing protein n=1 Tax=Rhodococcus koreensis TaxID=99653 RepID=UPI00366B4773